MNTGPINEKHRDSKKKKLVSDINAKHKNWEFFYD